MNKLTGRLRVMSAALVLCGTATAIGATGAAAASTGSLPASTGAARQAPAAGPAAASTGKLPVLVNCELQRQVRPGGFTFPCADQNAAVVGLHWATWTDSAFARGSATINDCVPSCAEGHFHTFPALFVVWRPRPLPGHPGTEYFTRGTVILTGQHTYQAGGQLFRLPVTHTTALSAVGGGIWP